MVTKVQLDRLASRIEALAPPRKEHMVAVIWPREGETEAQAEARHYRERPQDRMAAHVIAVRFVAARDGKPYYESDQTTPPESLLLALQEAPCHG